MALFRLRFIADDSLISRASCYATFAFFSHVEIVNEDGTGYIGAHADGGVIERPADYCRPTLERRYAIPCTDAQLLRMMQFARSHIGRTPYDFRDILGLLVHLDAKTPGHAICSWFVHDVAWEGGILMLNVLRDHGNRVTPDSLHLSNLLIGHCYFKEGNPQ